LLVAAAVDDAVAELDAVAEPDAVLELLEEQAVRASAQAPASPAIRRSLVRRSERIMGLILERPSIRELSRS
jgi:hypothetical protein